MIRNYITIGIRHMMKRKRYSFISAAGLAMSVAACLIIWRYVALELSYDNFHVNGDRIYRTIFTDYKNGEKLGSSPRFGYGLGPSLINDVPGVQAYVRTCPLPEEAVVELPQTLGEPKQFVQSDIHFADSTFFRVFSFETLYGNTDLALDDLSSVVITESVAKKYFGDTHPLGKVIRLSTRNSVRGEFTVTAVVKDLPENTHVRFDILLPFNLLLKQAGYREQGAAWSWVNFYTYIVLHPKTNARNVESKMPPLLTKYTGPNPPGMDFIMSLQPLREIHLTPENDNEQSFTKLYFLVAISVLILSIAWINYINLSTARAMERAREVGVKKAMGVVRRQLVMQFMVESFMINFASITLALLLAILILPFMSDIAGKRISFDLTTPFTWLQLGGLLFLGTLATGFYPAFLLSSFKTTEVIKGSTSYDGHSFFLRKALVVFQFAASLTLIIGSFTIYRQIGFMRNSYKGMDTDKILIVNGPRIATPSESDRLISFKEGVLRLASVSNVSSSWSIPGEGFLWNTGMTTLLNASREQTSMIETIHVVAVDPDFISTYGISLLAGRTWDPDRISDMTNAVIINEATLDVFNLGRADDVIGQELLVGGEDTVKILGVARNFHWSSLESAHEPVIFWPDKVLGQKFSIVVNGNFPGSIARIREQYEQQFPGNPFEYFFLDDLFNKQYKADEQFGKLFNLFTFLAIMIACLGLFGLASFSTVQRMKEISIRKVLGASVGSITALLSMQFLRLILVAACIAIPLSWLLMQRWLEGFAFRIAASWDLFIVPLVGLILIALASMSVQILHGARTNPSDVLRSQ